MTGVEGAERIVFGGGDFCTEEKGFLLSGAETVNNQAW
jgi:hypothetical protein